MEAEAHDSVIAEGSAPRARTLQEPATDGLPMGDKGHVFSLRKLAFFLAFTVVLVNLAFFALDSLLAGRFFNMEAHREFRSTLKALERDQGMDSLAVMLPVVHTFDQAPGEPIYESFFFTQHRKFQYPLTSLVPVYALVKLRVSDDNILRIFKAITFFGAALTVFLCFQMALRLLTLRERKPLSGSDKWALGVLFAIGGLFFYPLASSLTLGQIQTLLTLGFTAAMMCWISGREMTASILMGLMTAVKPQYALFFVWALVRRKFGVAAAGLCCVGAIGLVSLAIFGWHNNVEYLQVLRYIALRGEGFYENQSVNGLLNRALFNGNNMVWDPHAFAPVNRIVSLGTSLTSALLLAVAIFYPWGKQRRGGVGDFACMILAATMASPIAWVHHYGILLPILVWLWFDHLSYRTTRWTFWAFAVAYVLISDKIATANVLAAVSGWNVLQSYFYFATLLVLVLLLKSRSSSDARQFTPA